MVRGESVALVTLKAWRLVLGSGVGLIKEGRPTLPVYDLCEKVGFGSVLKEPENDGRVPVKDDP